MRWRTTGRFRFAATCLVLTILAGCAAPAEPTPAQKMIVQPGIDAERRGNYGFALLTYRYWANLRVGLAQYRLARLYERGRGIDRNYAEAARWYRAAAEIGYVPAHAALARMYEEGRGVPQVMPRLSRSTRRPPQAAMSMRTTRLGGRLSWVAARPPIRDARLLTTRSPRTPATSMPSSPSPSSAGPGSASPQDTGLAGRWYRLGRRQGRPPSTLQASAGRPSGGRGRAARWAHGRAAQSRRRSRCRPRLRRPRRCVRRGRGGHPRRRRSSRVVPARGTPR